MRKIIRVQHLTPGSLWFSAGIQNEPVLIIANTNVNNVYAITYIFKGSILRVQNLCIDHYIFDTIPPPRTDQI